MLVACFKLVQGKDGEVMEEWHPLLPVEKKLIISCLLVAAVLMIVLVWVSLVYFNVGKSVP